ncbi:hypothetical protein [Denitromonas sp.]|uniref:hypothetical protein n=1 Tax=Denitromonas sp. TaxID=2734609 RepID=UPI002AFE4AF7|nr:hypothetical protein [Denitromonas sp.]
MNSRLEDVGMSVDAGRDVKARLRADLRAAMKDRHTFEAKVIRALVAAIDNAEAPPIHAGQAASIQHHFRTGSAEVERLLLSGSDVRRVLLMEIDERERAATELERLNMMERAEALRAEVLLAKRYLE